MKLTNYQRDAFVRAVMQDVPKPDYAKLQAQAQEALVKAMSPAVRKVFRESPKALKNVTVHDLDERMYHRLVIGDLDNYADIIAPFTKVKADRERLREDLRRMAYGVSTLKQLKEALPELVRYMPTEDAPRKDLPAVHNIVAKLAEFGWPADRAAA